MVLRTRDHLENVALFAALTERQRRALSRGAVTVEAPPGQVLFDEGSEGHEIVVVLRGSVDVLRDGTRLATLGSGDAVGEAALLTQEYRNARVVAHTRVEILCIGESEITAAMAKSPAFARAVEALHAARVPQPAPPAAS